MGKEISRIRLSLFFDGEECLHNNSAAFSLLPIDKRVQFVDCVQKVLSEILARDVLKSVPFILLEQPKGAGDGIVTPTE